MLGLEESLSSFDARREVLGRSNGSRKTRPRSRTIASERVSWWFLSGLNRGCRVLQLSTEKKVLGTEDRMRAANIEYASVSSRNVELSSTIVDTGHSKY